MTRVRSQRRGLRYSRGEPTAPFYSDRPSSRPAKPAPGAHCADPEHCSVCLGVAVPRIVGVPAATVGTDPLGKKNAAKRERGRRVLAAMSHHTKRLG